MTDENDFDRLLAGPSSANADKAKDNMAITKNSISYLPSYIGEPVPRIIPRQKTINQNLSAGERTVSSFPLSLSPRPSRALCASFRVIILTNLRPLDRPAIGSYRTKESTLLPHRNATKDPIV